MKKTLTLSLFSMILFAVSTNVNAQAFGLGTKNLNLGIGFGGYYNYGWTSTADHSQIPTIFISYDQGLIEDIGPGVIGIGGFLGYSSASAKYDWGTYFWEWKYTNFVIGARGTYHYPLDNEKLDVYGGLSLGLWAWTYKYTDSDPYWNGTLDVSDTYMDLYYALSVGGKYFFTDKIGVFAELGYDIAYLKVGLTMNLGGSGAAAE